MNDILKAKAYAHRARILEMIHAAGSGHPGGSLSIIDVLTCLYEYKSPSDQVILSAGHLCPALYVVLADKGFLDKKELDSLRKFGSPLQGHPERNPSLGLLTTSGPLGQGLSVAAGLALTTSNKVFCITSDGEHQEGGTWEAAQFAAFHNLGNLVNIVDVNGVQIDGHTKDILDLRSLRDKYEAFGWHVLEIDGHNFELIKGVFDYVRHKRSEKPLCVLAHTILGKGVSFMQNNPSWHGRSLSDEELEHALKQIYQHLHRHHLHAHLKRRGVKR